MDIRFLESLIVVVKMGSIAAAAREQGLTAAAISQRIRVLERDLGTKLLSRSAHKAVPTQACINLIPRAQILVREGYALKANLDSSGLSGSLRLGAISTALTDFIPKIVQTITTHAPKAKLTVTPGTSAQLYKMLLQEEIDAAILVKPKFILPKQLRIQSLAQQRLVLISSYPVDCSVTKMIRKTPLIVYDTTSWGGRISWHWLERQQHPLQIICEIDSLETIAVLVEQKLGIAIVPEWTGLLKRHSNLNIMPVDTSRKNDREISFLSSRHTAASNLIALAQTSISKQSIKQS